MWIDSSGPEHLKLPREIIWSAMEIVGILVARPIKRTFIPTSSDQPSRWPVPDSTKSHLMTIGRPALEGTKHADSTDYPYFGIWFWGLSNGARYRLLRRGWNQPASYDHLDFASAEGDLIVESSSRRVFRLPHRCAG